MAKRCPRGGAGVSPISVIPVAPQGQRLGGSELTEQAHRSTALTLLLGHPAAHRGGEARVIKHN